MNKKELVTTVAKNTDLTQDTVAKVLDEIFDTIIEGATNDGRCIFGSHLFKLKKTAARTGRNPNTGESIPIPEKQVIVYRKVI